MNNAKPDGSPLLQTNMVTGLFFKRFSNDRRLPHIKTTVVSYVCIRPLKDPLPKEAC